MTHRNKRLTKHYKNIWANRMSRTTPRMKIRLRILNLILTEQLAHELINGEEKKKDRK